MDKMSKQSWENSGETYAKWSPKRSFDGQSSTSLRFGLLTSTKG